MDNPVWWSPCFSFSAPLDYSSKVYIPAYHTRFPPTIHPPLCIHPLQLCLPRRIPLTPHNQRRLRSLTHTLPVLRPDLDRLVQPPLPDPPCLNPHKQPLPPPLRRRHLELQAVVERRVPLHAHLLDIRLALLPQRVGVQPQDLGAGHKHIC